MKTVAILFGRKGSTGLPGKNVMPLLGRPCCEYPMRAALDSGVIDRLYVSTDDPAIAAIGRRHGAEVIERPSWLREPAYVLEDCIAHGFAEVGKRLDMHPDVTVLLQANAPCVTADVIDEAVTRLIDNPDLDSVVTAAEMTAYAPSRARRLDDGRLIPMGVDDGSRGDRKAGGSVYYTDGGVTAVRRDVLRTMANQPGPFRWQGARIGMVEQMPSTGDIDAMWQVPVVEWWLRLHGHTERSRAA